MDKTVLFIFLSDVKKWSWLHKDYVLKMFSENRLESRKRYRKFILLKTPEKTNQILGRRKWPSVMGSAGFTDWVKKKFFSKKRYEEVPESKLLARGVSVVRDMVYRSYGVKEEEILATRRGRTQLEGYQA